MWGVLHKKGLERWSPINHFTTFRRTNIPVPKIKGVTSVPWEQLGDPRFQPDIPEVLLSDKKMMEISLLIFYEKRQSLNFLISLFQSTIKLGLGKVFLTHPNGHILSWPSSSINPICLSGEYCNKWLNDFPWGLKLFIIPVWCNISISCMCLTMAATFRPFYVQ